MYSLEIKAKAIELYEEAGFDINQIYDILTEEDNFTGTKAIIRYWIKNRDTIMERIESSSDYDDEFDDVCDDEPTLYDSDVDEMSIEEMKAALIKLRRSRQRLMDQNRILRKMFREQDRVINATEDLLKQILTLIKGRKPVPFTPTRNKLEDNVRRIGIVQLSDLHLNEAVFLQDTKGKNEFNFHIASRRLQKYADRIRLLFMPLGIDSIVLAMTGDMFNSNRRKDEILRNLYALSEGFLIGADIIGSFMQDLAQSFNIEVISVFGNESRLDEEVQSIDFHNNFDYLLHYYLQKLLSEQENVMFHEAVTDHELLTNINGANILFWHGHNRISIDKQILKYNKMGKIVHYVITGHFHHLYVKEEHAQSGSLVGDNAYNFHRLGSVARASQTMYIVENDQKWPSITPIPVDLQETHGYPGYPVPENAEQYSLRKAPMKGDGQTILRIVI